MAINDNGYFVICPNGWVGLTNGRTKTGRIRCLVAANRTRAYAESSLRYATVEEAKAQGVYGVGGEYARAR